MNKSEIIQLCRLCQTNKGVHCISKENLEREISECTKITLKENKLPSKICNECKKIINTFYKYLQIVYKVDIELKQKLCDESSKIETEVHKCNYCLKHYQTLNNLLLHQRVCNQIIKEKCNLENDKTRPEEDIELDDIIKCEVCTEKCICNKTNLKSKYVCKWGSCNKKYSSANSLRTHQMKHEHKPYLCVTCGKRFIKKNSLKNHEQIHSPVKAFSCNLCNIRFSVKGNLRTHEKKHHEGLKFYCTQCTKVYISKSSLERHELIHSGIKEHQCKECPSAFYTKKELIKHERYHQDIRQYKCNICLKSFFERHHVTVHLRSHTGERPYRCTIDGCRKAFVDSQKLKRHLKTRHIEWD